MRALKAVVCYCHREHRATEWPLCLTYFQGFNRSALEPVKAIKDFSGRVPWNGTFHGSSNIEPILGVQFLRIEWINLSKDKIMSYS